MTMQADRLHGETTRRQLTRRERDVLVLMAMGMSYGTIAARLGIGVNTVRSYGQQLLRKLDSHSKLEAVVRAKELGLLGR